jgi:CubicO group peptidase (beta-lactamase class C family)
LLNRSRVRRLIARSFLGIGVVVFAPGSVCRAQDPRAALRSHAHAVGAEVLARGTPGISVAVAVAVDGLLVYSECFGEADLEERVPVRPTTKFRIGSISKPLVVALAANLGEAKFQIEEVESIAEPFALEKKAAASAGGH